LTMSAIFEAKADVKDEADGLSWDNRTKGKIGRFPISTSVT